MSLLSIVWSATWLVKFLLLALVMISGWAWAFFFAKTWMLRGLDHLLETAENHMRHTEPQRWIETEPQDPASALLFFLFQEWKNESSLATSAHQSHVSHLSVYETSQQFLHRLEKIADLTMAREMMEIERGLSYLASVGSITPFVGLLGTVWGLLHSFQNMMGTQAMHLNVVAPALSEALFATAVGFFVAFCTRTDFAFIESTSWYTTRISQKRSGIINHHFSSQRSNGWLSNRFMILNLIPRSTSHPSWMCCWCF
jgi:biopolymer transport protein TolQ